MVNLIAQNPWAQVCDLSHSRPFQQVARRIRGRIDKNGFGVRRKGRSYGFGSILKGVFFIDGNELGAPSEITNEIGVTGIVGIGKDHFFIAFQESAQSHEESRRRSRSNNDAIGLETPNPIILLIVPANGFSQLRNSQTVSIVCVSLSQSLYGRVLDAFRRIEIGLPHFKMDD
jgi:hypothetical protein